MWKKIVAVILFAVATFLAGCSHKPTETLTVTGINTPLTGMEIRLHSGHYGLDYTGTFAECSAKDPLTGDDFVSFKKENCITPFVGAVLSAGYYDTKHCYVVYTEEFPGGREEKVAYRLSPDIR